MSFFGYQIPSALSWLTAAVSVGGIFTYVIAKGMSLFVLKRLIETVFVVWIIASLTFILLRVLPGGPFDTEKALPPEVMANLAKKYHLDDPFIKQYGDYMVGLLHGEIGQSYKYIGRDIS